MEIASFKAHSLYHAEKCLSDEQSFSNAVYVAACDPQSILTLLDEVERYRGALAAADAFMTNGIALGYIRMPDPETSDPASLTPGIVRAALNPTGTDK